MPVGCWREVFPAISIEKLGVTCQAAEPDERTSRYEKHGWRLNGSERVVPFPPHPLDISYSIGL